MYNRLKDLDKIIEKIANGDLIERMESMCNNISVIKRDIRDLKKLKEKQLNGDKNVKKRKAL